MKRNKLWRETSGVKPIIIPKINPEASCQGSASDPSAFRSFKRYLTINIEANALE